MKFFANNFKGIMLCSIIAVLAKIVSSYVPVGSVTLAIIFGIVVTTILKKKTAFASGIAFCEKKLLSFAIALMGVNLDFTLLKQLGSKAMLLVVLSMIVTIFAGIKLGKIFKIDKKLALLLGIGNAICGSSAIATSNKIINADENKVGLSIAIVNLMGTIGIFLVPFIGSVILGLPDVNNGILIGNILQAVGQVLAGGFSVSDQAGQAATIIKMGRVLMLTPILIILIATAKTNKTNESSNKITGIPLFIIGFAFFSILTSLGLLPESITAILSKLSKYSLIIAMAGIGLKISLKSIASSGKSSFYIGSIIFLIQIAFNSIVIYFLF